MKKVKTHIVPENNALFGGVKKQKAHKISMRKLGKIHIFLTEPTRLLCHTKACGKCRVSLKSFKEIHHPKMWCKGCLKKYRRMTL